MISPSNRSNLINELATLAKLRAEGGLNDEEFRTLKEGLIAGIGASGQQKSNPKHILADASDIHERNDAERPVASVDTISGRILTGSKGLFLFSVSVFIIAIITMIATQESRGGINAISWLVACLSFFFGFWSGITWLIVAGTRGLILKDENRA